MGTSSSSVELPRTSLATNRLGLEGAVGGRNQRQHRSTLRRDTKALTANLRWKGLGKALAQADHFGVAASAGKAALLGHGAQVELGGLVLVGVDPRWLPAWSPGDVFGEDLGGLPAKESCEP